MREADDILLQEIRNAGIYNDIGQAFVVLLPVKSVGVMGDCRTYEQACAIRLAVTINIFILVNDNTVVNMEGVWQVLTS